MKILHTAIKKITEDIERFNFNTAVSAMMICVNELGSCNKRSVLEPLSIIVSPFAPHITEEVWQKLGNNQSIVNAEWPKYNEEILQESSFTYPISFNGRTRFNIDISADADKDEIVKIALDDERSKKWTDGFEIVKTIVVPKKIVNIVLKPKA